MPLLINRIIKPGLLWVTEEFVEGKAGAAGAIYSRASPIGRCAWLWLYEALEVESQDRAIERLVVRRSERYGMAHQNGW